MGPREVDGRDAGVEVDRQGGRHADERQAQVFGHGPARHLDLVDDEGIDALVADRGRGVPEEHHRLPFDSAKPAPQGGEALELTELLIPRGSRRGEIFPADLAELQARRPDRPLEVGDLEVDHLMAPRLEPPPQGRERIEVTRRGETQDADPTDGSSPPPWCPLCPCRPRPAMSFGSCMLDSPSLDRPFGILQTLVQALRPSPSARPRRPTLLMGNGKGVAVRFLGGACGPLGDSCGHPEPPRRDADKPLEVAGELALVGEARVRGHLRQGQVRPCLQEFLGPLHAARDDVLVRRQPGGRLELPGEVVGAEMGRRRHLLQGQAGVEVFLDVRDDGAELPPRERTVRPTGRGAGGGGGADQVDSEKVGQGLGGEPAPGGIGRQFVIHRQHRGPELREVQAVERGERHRAGSRSNASAATRATNLGSRKTWRESE